MNKVVQAILIVIAVASIVVGVAVAASYVLQTSNAVPVTVTGAVVNVPIILTSNASAVTDLDSVTLTATVTNPAVIGDRISFFDGVVPVDSAPILNAGSVYTATITLTDLEVRVHTFTAGPTPP